MLAFRAGRRVLKHIVPIEISALSRISVAGFAKKAEESAGGKDHKTPRLLKILEELTEDEMPKLSPEDAQLWKDATKEYNRLKMMQHRAWQTDLSIKLQLKKAALAALPEDLRKLADRLETERVPLNRQMFTHTPPIPGFNQQQRVGKRKRGQSGRG
ncbi:g7833 [Coccomyxa elongata]